MADVTSQKLIMHSCLIPSHLFHEHYAMRLSLCFCMRTYGVVVWCVRVNSACCRSFEKSTARGNITRVALLTELAQDSTATFQVLQRQLA